MRPPKALTPWWSA